MAKSVRIAIVEDDASWLKLLSAELEPESTLSVKKYATAEDLLADAGFEPQIIVIDYYLNGTVATAMNGMELIRALRVAKPGLPCILLSSKADLSTASRHEELVESLTHNREAVPKMLADGGFFYFMKNSSAPKKMKELLLRLTRSIEL
ncbi:MAG: response regulator [Flavobacteriales bacterium]